MNNQLETTLAPWSETDVAFFRITSALMDPAFLRGAGVLLASYDAEDAERAERGPHGGASHTPALVQAPV